MNIFTQSQPKGNMTTCCNTWRKVQTKMSFIFIYRLYTGRWRSGGDKVTVRWSWAHVTPGLHSRLCKHAPSLGGVARLLGGVARLLGGVARLLYRWADLTAHVTEVRIYAAYLHVNTHSTDLLYREYSRKGSNISGLSYLGPCCRSRLGQTAVTRPHHQVALDSSASGSTVSLIPTSQLKQ